MSEAWYLHRIPRIAHFYWGHDYMPWVRYLTLQTFRHWNPDWKMVLWQPPEPVHVEGFRPDRDAYGRDTVPEGVLTPDYLPVAKEFMEHRSIDVEQLLGKDLSCVTSVHVREQIKGDYLRAWFMGEEGGCSIDMDILFWKPMEAGHFNRPEHTDVTATVIRRGGIFYWGFMFGATGSPFYQRMWQAARAVNTDELRNGHNFYRVAGHLAAELWPRMDPLPPGMLDMPFYTVYADTDRFDLNQELNYPPERIGVHWHGSSSYGTFVRMRPETFQPGPTLMHRVVQKALEAMR